MLHGIDIAAYQDETYDTNGLAFVIIKRTEAQGYVNPKATAQTAHGRAAGLLIGHYHYPHIHDDPVADADYFLGHLGSDLHTGDLLALDWEWYGQAGVTAAEADAFKDAWLAHVHSREPGHRVIAYSDRSNWLGTDRNSNAGDGLWIADYVTAGKPRIQDDWLFHQYTNAAPQGGDGDVANPVHFPDAAALHAWAGVQTTPPTHPTQEDDMPSFTVMPGGALCGASFPRGSAHGVGFFTDNTLVGGPADPGAHLRVVVWASGKAPEIHEVVVGNKDGNQTMVTFSDPANTHTVTVTRTDKGAAYPVFAEVS